MAELSNVRIAAGDRRNLMVSWTVQFTPPEREQGLGVLVVVRLLGVDTSDVDHGGTRVSYTERARFTMRTDAPPMGAVNGVVNVGGHVNRSVNFDASHGELDEDHTGTNPFVGHIADDDDEIIAKVHIERGPILPVMDVSPAGEVTSNTVRAFF